MGRTATNSPRYTAFAIGNAEHVLAFAYVQLMSTGGSVRDSRDSQDVSGGGDAGTAAMP